MPASGISILILASDFLIYEFESDVVISKIM